MWPWLRLSGGRQLLYKKKANAAWAWATRREPPEWNTHKVLNRQRKAGSNRTWSHTDLSELDAERTSPDAKQPTNTSLFVRRDLGGGEVRPRHTSRLRETPNVADASAMLSIGEPIPITVRASETRTTHSGDNRIIVRSDSESVIVAPKRETVKILVKLANWRPRSARCASELKKHTKRRLDTTTACSRGGHS